MFAVKELKLFNHDFLVLAANESILLFLQIWLGVISVIIYYPDISAFTLLLYTIIFLHMELTPNWKNNFQYKKNK